MDVRSFIAVDPSKKLREGVLAFVEQLRSETKGVKWADSFHLTLRFLGGVEEGLLQTIKDRLTRVAVRHRPFSLEVGGIGVFPNPARPRVVWLGLEGETERLIALQRDVAEAVSDLPVHPEEKREFRPHLTLGRIRDPREVKGLDYLLKAEAPDLGGFRVEELILFKSDLTPKGARYTKIETFKLGGKNGTGEPGEGPS